MNKNSIIDFPIRNYSEALSQSSLLPVGETYILKNINIYFIFLK